jgi:hypothetical protein
MRCAKTKNHACVSRGWVGHAVSKLSLENVLKLARVYPRVDELSNLDGLTQEFPGSFILFANLKLKSPKNFGDESTPSPDRGFHSKLDAPVLLLHFGSYTTSDAVGSGLNTTL